MSAVTSQLTSSVPVEAAQGGERQAGIARRVDPVAVRVQLGGAAAAAGVGDVTAQRRQEAGSRRGAVQNRLGRVLGGQSLLELEAEHLDSELHLTCSKTKRFRFQPAQGSDPVLIWFQF